MTEPSPPSPAPARRSARWLLLAAALVVGGVVTRNALLGRALGNQEMLLFGQATWTPGARAAVRVVIRRHSDGKPIPDASVRLYVARRKAEIVEVGNFTTGAAGTIQASFPVPEGDGPARLLAIAESPWGSSYLDRPIRLAPAYRLFLTTDRPAYRAGQTVRLHARAFHAGTGRPAGGLALTVRALAPGDVPIAVRELGTDDGGSAATEIAIAPGAPGGLYRLKAVAARSAVEAWVPVVAGPAPPFVVRFEGVTPFVQPGGVLRGSLRASDRLGSFLRGARARVWLENSAGRTVSWTSGRLESQGTLAFGLPAPPGADLQVLRLYGEVTQPDLRAARAMAAVAVTPRPIQLLAVPEPGAPVPGIENRVYVIARYPDGTPAPAALEYELDGRAGTATTSELGVATLAFTPASRRAELSVSAADGAGRRGRYTGVIEVAEIPAKEWHLRERYRMLTRRPPGDRPAAMLIRPERGTCAPGSRLRVDVFAPGGEDPVYLDGIAEGQTALTRAAWPHQGRARFELDLPPDVTGTLWLRAYRIGPWGEVARAERAVFVQPAPPGGLRFRPVSRGYEPGEPARFTSADSGAGSVTVAVLRTVGPPGAPGAAGSGAGLMVAGPRTLAEPSVPGLRWEDAAAGANEATRQEAALAALALLPPPPDWSLEEDAFARKQTEVQERRARSWRQMRWAVLLALAALWLLAIRILARSSGRPPRAEPDSTPAGSPPAPAEGPAPPEDRDAEPERPHAPGRFIAFAAAVSLAATLLLGLVGEPPARQRGDTAAETLFALRQARQARWMADASRRDLLPPPVPPGTPVPEVAFWTTALRHNSSEPRNLAFAAPAEPGEWRLAAVAIVGSGGVARADAALNVTADFLAEFEPPPALRAGDVVSLTARVRNTLPAPQSLRLKLMAGPGLTVEGDPVLEEEVPGGAGITRAFRVRALHPVGRSVATLAVSGLRRSRSFRREIEVLPAAMPATQTRAGLAAGRVSHEVELAEPPQEAMAVLYPSPAALAAGHFPRVQHSPLPGSQPRAAAIDVGRLALPPGGAARSPVAAAMGRLFQEMLAYRDDAGGFRAVTGREADAVSTAYAAAVLTAARDALPGADVVAGRARAWLRAHRLPDGSWDAPPGVDGQIATAFVRWCPGSGSTADDAAASEADSALDDPYVLALSLGGIPSPAPSRAAEAARRALGQRLAAAADSVEGARRWVAAGRTLQGLTGDASAVETTALAVIALAPDSHHRRLVSEAAAFLIQARLPGGSWGSPFATALVLRALAAAGVPSGSGPLAISVNGQDPGALSTQVPARDLRPFLRVGRNTIAVGPSGATPAAYEVSLTGAGIPRTARGGAPIFSAGYQPHRAKAGQSITFAARVSAADGPRLLCLEVPLPAGFRPVRSDLEGLVAHGSLVGFHAGARQVILYVEAGRRGQARDVSFRLIAPGPAEVLAPAPSAYPAADPSARALGRVTRLAVDG